MRTKAPHDRFYYVLNDDSFQRIQIFVKVTTLKKLLLSYELCVKLARESSSPNPSYFPVRLNSYGRACKGGTADHYSEQGAKIKQSLGSADFFVQNVGGSFEVFFPTDVFQQALEQFDPERSKEVSRWAGEETIGVFTLLAQQQGRGNQQGKVIIEFTPCIAPLFDATATADVWPLLVGVYANLRRQNKGSENGPRGKRRRVDQSSRARNVRRKQDESKACEVAEEVILVPVKTEVKQEPEPEPEPSDNIDESLALFNRVLLYTELTPERPMLAVVKEEPWDLQDLFKNEELGGRGSFLKTEERLDEESDEEPCWESFLSIDPCWFCTIE